MDVSFREILVRNLRGLKSCHALDAAAEAANMTKMPSSNLEASIISIDIDKEVANDIYQTVDRNKGTFVLCDLANLPFKNHTFCCIVCDLAISTIENWRHRQILKEFRRTLEPRTNLFITDYLPEESPKSVRDRLAVEACRPLQGDFASQGLDTS